MARFKETSKKTPIFLAVENPLAYRHLVNLVSRRSDILIYDKRSSAAGQSSSRLLIIFDRGTSSIPLPTSLRKLRSTFRESPILVIGEALGDGSICQLLRLGAAGFIAYEAVERELITAIKAIRGGRLWVPAKILELFARKVVDTSFATRLETSVFTSTENRIIDLLSHRLSNKEIAASLGIAPRTVKFHLANIFSKLGVHDRQSVFATNVLQQLRDTRESTNGDALASSGSVGSYSR